MPDTNKEVVRKIEEAWDAGRLDELDQYFAPGFRSHASAPGSPPGLEGAKMAHQMAMAAFPDRKMRILDLVAEGDKVLVRTELTGTNKGGLPWLGVPANDRQIKIEAWSVYRLEDGRVIEHWGLNDVYALSIQLGVLQPAMPA